MGLPGSEIAYGIDVAERALSGQLEAREALGKIMEPESAAELSVVVGSYIYVVAGLSALLELISPKSLPDICRFRFIELASSLQDLKDVPLLIEDGSAPVSLQVQYIASELRLRTGGDSTTFLRSLDLIEQEIHSAGRIQGGHARVSRTYASTEEFLAEIVLARNNVDRIKEGYTHFDRRLISIAEQGGMESPEDDVRW